LPGRAGDPTGVTAPRHARVDGSACGGLARLVCYIVLFTFALVVFFLTMRTAKDRGSDAGRLLPFVRGNPERPEA